MKKTICTLLIVFAITYLNAQETEWQYGISAGKTFNFHSADFSKLPDVPNCCNQFSNNSGDGFYFGANVKYKFSDNLFLKVQLEFGDYSSIFDTRESTKVIQNDKIVDGEFTHTIESDINHLHLGVLIDYYLIDNLFVNAGGFLGHYLKTDYHQYEKITKPNAQATFLDADGNDSFKRIRNDFSGSIENTSSITYGLIVGAGYELPLNKQTLKLTPEINCQYFLNDITSDLNWSIRSLKVGLNLSYRPVNYTAIYRNIEQFDTVKISNKKIKKAYTTVGMPFTRQNEEYTDDRNIITVTTQRTDTLYIPQSADLTAIVKCFGLDSNNNIMPASKLRFEQFVSNRYQPLLNYIFFDSSSSIMPNKYATLNNEQAKNFNIKSLSNTSTLATYYQTLNIIGQRLSHKPTARIRLIGCNSDNGIEKGNIKLSEERSQVIKDYFVNVWNINPKNISVEFRNLPQKYSSPVDEFKKAEENRRVEIYSNNPEILAPIFISDTITKVFPEKMRFEISSKSDFPIEKWSLNLQNDKNETVSEFSKAGKSTPPQNIDIDLMESDDLKSGKINTLYYDFVVFDKENNQFKTEKAPLITETIRVENKRKNKSKDIEIDKFNLILFDFNSSKLADNNEKIIETVKTKIKTDSKIKIFGYTDNTGNEADNKKLSEERAKATYQAFSILEAEYEGLGEEALNNNELPEGRFYNRTVEISIETPVNSK